MREILFRGKRIDNREWVEGFLFHLGYDGCCSFCIGTEQLSANDYGEIYRNCYEEVNPETLCQYTGLIDKNGHRIFENDILDAVDYRVRKGLVKFGLYKQCDMASDYECGNQGFYVWFDENSTLRPDIYYWHGNSSVSGNIFDNPELLKDGDETENRS